MNHISFIPCIYSGVRALSFMMCGLGLVGCNTVAQKPSNIAPAADSRPPITRSVPASPFVVSMLEKADALFAQGKSLSPDDNAYVRYRAAQIMEPENTQARSGLNAILINEVQVVRDDLERGRISRAQKRLNELKPLYPEEALLLGLEKELGAAREALNRNKINKQVVESVPDDGRIYLDIEELASRSTVVQQQLADMAKTLVASGESVMIYARNDAEGRWIYSQMREAVPDYRVRGDIRIGKPAIRFLPPLD